MSNTYSIPAQLDLAQSLSMFEALVRPLLNIDNLRQWDGTVLMARERAIRDGAMVLAGQCIALLLSTIVSGR